MQRAGTFSIRGGLSRALTIRVEMVAWAAVCATATMVVALLQTQNRGPLAWDEAVRVRAGQEFVFALRAGGLAAAWGWANDQVFYPFVSPLLHGLVLLVVDDPLVAAWVPSLAAYATLGLLAAALVRELGFGSKAAWIAALLCWSTPLYARLAAGGFVDSLGACASVATVLLVVRSLRTTRVVDAVGASVAGVFAFWIRYDYGLVLFGVLMVTTVIAGIRRQSQATLKMLAMTGGVSAILAELWFIPNAAAKWAGFAAFFNIGNTQANVHGISLNSLTHYSSVLWYDPDLGLSSLVVDLIVVAIVWGVVNAVRNPRLTALLVFIAGWYAFYTAAAGRSTPLARYMAQVLPFTFVLIGLFVSTAVPALRHALLDRGVARRLGSVAVLVVGLELIRQIGGPTGIGQQFWFVQPNPAVGEIVDFLSANLGSADSSLLFLGETNEVSPDLVRLVWMRAAGRPGQRVLRADQVPANVRPGLLYDWARREGINLVLAVRVGNGSQPNTSNIRAALATDTGYPRHAAELDGSSNFNQVAHLTVDAGDVEVVLWRVAPGAP